MLKYVLSTEHIEKNPAYAIAYGVLFATIGMLFATLIFRESLSFPTIFLATLAASPIIVKFLKKDRPVKGGFFKKYHNVINIYSYLFFGMAIAFAMWYSILPQEYTNLLFDAQLTRFATGYFTGSQIFSQIVINNLSIMFAFFVLSFFFGSGSVFLLTWNASILGIMWGNTIKSLMALFSSQTVINSMLVFPYLLPEVWAYFIAAIAGAVVSLGMGKHEPNYNDSFKLLIVAVNLILVAAAIETVILSGL